MPLAAMPAAAAATGAVASLLSGAAASATRFVEKNTVIETQVSARAKS
jgi:hypothetical protein